MNGPAIKLNVVLHSPSRVYIPELFLGKLRTSSGSEMKTCLVAALETNKFILCTPGRGGSGEKSFFVSSIYTIS